MPQQETLPLEAAPYLDISNPEYSIRSPEVRAARDSSWYARTPYGLAVLRHHEMGKLLIHKSLRQGSHAWPEHNGVNEGHFAKWWGETILVTEGADHRRLRQLVNPAFSPKTVKKLLPEFERITNDLIDDFIEKGECDFMKDFADPYAGRVLALLIGLPEELAGEILELSASMGLALGVTYKQSLPEIEAATEKMYALVDSVLEERIANPGDDMLSMLASASQGEDKLSREELRNMGVMLAFAGVDTTRNQLGLGMSMFLQNPVQWEILAENPKLDMAASAECMRMRPTITWVTREAIEDFEFQGLEIAKGTTLHLFSESAGTDPEAFPEAQFDITAKRDKNYGFGGGMHLCLGQIVAKNDMAVAYRILSQRLTAPKANGQATYLPDSGNTGPTYLPIAFAKR
ncbi:MAG: cytochrome P450 [Mangrovicoccus sp.]|nr:cytochrome P450 [Mangrovicoccus sp.]